MSEHTEKLRWEPCVRCTGDGGREVLSGAWCRQVRENAGYGLRSFARLVKRSAAYISDIERDRRVCPDDLAKAYERMETSPVVKGRLKPQPKEVMR